jgi:hypothetical protein
VVDDVNDWRSTILAVMDKIKSKRSGVLHLSSSELPAWLKSMDIELRTVANAYQGVACYMPSKSEISDGKLCAKISMAVGGSNDASLKYTLNHEIQHAFDDWIIRTRRKSGTLEDFMTVPSGYSELSMDDDPLVSIVRLSRQPDEVTLNDIFVMFDQCTYWFSETERNAYLREWALFVSDYVAEYGSKPYDWYKECSTGINAGQSPVMILDSLYDALDNWDKFPISDEDWEYAMAALNSKWTKRYLGHHIDGAGKEGVRNILVRIIDTFVPKIIRKYMRIVKDYGMNMTNAPKWFMARTLYK